MASYLVTGGCGFIGSHLVDSLLADGHRVRVLDDLSTGFRHNIPAEAELMTGCVSDAKAVANALSGMDGCYHLAAIASVDRARTHLLDCHRINIGGMVTILEAIAQAPIPVVYASSAAIYGDPTRMPIDEDTAARPINAYGADKLSCELHAGAAGRVHGISSFGLRLFNVYGLRQDPSSPYSGVISIFLDRARRGENLTIFGDGGQIRDFVHVSDVVRAFRAAMTKASADAPAANICTGCPTSVRDLALIALGGDDSRIVLGPERPGDIRFSIGDGSRAASLLGWRPRISITDGLASLAAQPATRP